MCKCERVWHLPLYSVKEAQRVADCWLLFTKIRLINDTPEDYGIDKLTKTSSELAPRNGLEAEV